MRIMPKKKNSAYGSIVLEAAISIPLVLSLLLGMLSSITLVNAELYLQRATENVVSELNVTITFAANGFICLDEITGYLGIGNADFEDKELVEEGLGIIGAVSGVTGIDLEDVVSTAVLGRYVRDRILVEYGKLIENGWVYERLLSDVSVYLDYCGSEHSIYVRVFYSLGAGNYTVSRSYTSSIALYADDYPIGQSASDNKEQDDIWEKENFERGTILREKYGGDLPYNYPVISAFSEGEAVSIKSVDTTAPKYQTESGLDKKVKNCIDDLSGFNGAKYGNIEISDEDIRSRKLILVIPENTSRSSENHILNLVSYAKERGVELVIEKFGISSKYSDPGIEQDKEQSSI